MENMLDNKSNRKITDLTGKKFGRLTVMKFDKRVKETSKNKKIYYKYYWKCKCDCGKKTVVLASNLINGNTKSCGCLQKEIQEERIKKQFEKNFKDLTGMRFGRLIAKKMERKPDTQGNMREYWLCKCDCGNTSRVLKSSLLKNKTISCGCVLKEHSKQNIKKCEEHRQNNIHKEGTRIDYLSNKVTKQNTTGVRGVSYTRKNGKYRAYIYFKNKRIDLGEYMKLEEAAKARSRAGEMYYKPILEKYNYKSKNKKENEEEFE